MNIELMTQLVAEGKTMVEAAAALGMSKSTFIRKKRSNPEISRAYDAALERYRTGVKLDQAMTAQYGDEPERFVPVESQLAEFLAGNRGASFRRIAEGTQLHPDSISAALAKLMLDRNEVKAIRDRSGNFRYFLVTGRGNEQEEANNGNWTEGFGGRTPARSASRKRFNQIGRAAAGN